MKKNILSAIMFAASLVLAHGGDQPGPHGGFIEMPGAFHTEVVPEKGNSFKIYLIDMNFQNPSVKDSVVEARVERGNKKMDLSCAPREDYFQCTLTGPFAQAKKLIVKAKREQMQGNEISYKLPLHRK